MLTLALVTALVGPEIGTSQNSTCPSGNIEFVSSKAKADYSVRFVNSRATADCVVRWVSVAPGPGHWREVSSFPDFRIYVTDGIADITVLAE